MKRFALKSFELFQQARNNSHNSIGINPSFVPLNIMFLMIPYLILYFFIYSSILFRRVRIFSCLIFLQKTFFSLVASATYQLRRILILLKKLRDNQEMPECG